MDIRVFLAFPQDLHEVSITIATAMLQTDTSCQADLTRRNKNLGDANVVVSGRGEEEELLDQVTPSRV